MFGKSSSSTSTSKISRPGYVNDFTGGLINDINGAQDSQYANLSYASLNQDQQDSLNKMMNNTDFQGYVDQLMGAGAEGTAGLDTAYNKINNLYSSGNITPEAIDRLTNQLYSPTDVEEGINQANAASERTYSTSTAPDVAQQTMQGVYTNGFGSSQRLGKARAEEALVNEEQGNADSITSNAYQNAQNQALGILNSNQSNTRSALSGLVSNSGALAGMYGTAGQYSQNMLTQGMQASQQSLQDRQNEMNNNYSNQINAQNQQLQNIQNRINAASGVNGVLGQKTTTISSGGGSGMLGGAMAGAAAGSAAGPWGALAGAVIGAAAS